MFGIQRDQIEVIATDDEEGTDGTTNTNKVLTQPTTTTIIDDPVVTIQPTKYLSRQRVRSYTSDSVNSDVPDKENAVFHEPS